MKKNLDELTFEEALKKLEENVASLEGGDIGLEEAIKIYEEGMTYSNLLTKKLDSAEKKIEELTVKNGRGGKETFSLNPLETN